MDPILDETSLVPSAELTPSVRIVQLARVLRALDNIGACRVLRSVRDAVDRNIGDKQSLRFWCFNLKSPIDRDAGRLVAGRLANAPYIDGPGGLFATAEGDRVVEAIAQGVPAFGIGLAAMTNGLLTALTTGSGTLAAEIDVQLSYLDRDGERLELTRVLRLVDAADIAQNESALQAKVDGYVSSGTTLVQRAAELFPKLRLGTMAYDQIRSLQGNEPVFRQLIRHLRALNNVASRWNGVGPFEPSVTFSVESRSTLNHGRYGPMRDFPSPPGFPQERWTLHTKLTGGNGARLYFRAVHRGGQSLVLVGYFGAHLPTVEHPT